MNGSGTTEQRPRKSMEEIGQTFINRDITTPEQVRAELDRRGRPELFDKVMNAIAAAQLASENHPAVAKEKKHSSSAEENEATSERPIPPMSKRKRALIAVGVLVLCLALTNPTMTDFRQSGLSSIGIIASYTNNGAVVPKGDTHGFTCYHVTFVPPSSSLPYPAKVCVETKRSELRTLNMMLFSVYTRQYLMSVSRQNGYESITDYSVISERHLGIAKNLFLIDTKRATMERITS